MPGMANTFDILIYKKKKVGHKFKFTNHFKKKIVAVSYLLVFLN